MAITGIDTLDGKQIIAAGASSAISAQQALQTSGGNSLQGLYDFVSTNSGSWTGGGGGGGNFLYLSGTACLATNGGPIMDGWSQWKYCPPGEQNWNTTVTTAHLSGAQFVLREITNGISSFDLTARYKGIALPSPQTAKGNKIPFGISTYPVSYTPIMMSVSPVYTYYADNTFSNMEAFLTYGLEGYSIGPDMWINSSYPITSTPDFGLRNSYTQFEIHTYVR